jgi:hypothetical protein
VTRKPFLQRVKYRARRRLLMAMQKIDSGWTLRWASRRGWIGSYDQRTWYMRDDDGKERV